MKVLIIVSMRTASLFMMQGKSSSLRVSLVTGSSTRSRYVLAPSATFLSMHCAMFPHDSELFPISSSRILEKSRLRSQSLQQFQRAEILRFDVDREDLLPCDPATRSFPSALWVKPGPASLRWGAWLRRGGRCTDEPRDVHKVEEIVSLASM